MAQLSVAAIAPQAEDNFATAVTDFQKYIDREADAIAPDHSFDYIHEAHQEFAQDTSREFNQVRLESILSELAQGERILESKARLTRRKEFSQWKQTLNATASDIRKWVKLVLTFGDFPIEKISAIASSVNIYSLCVPKFEGLVEKFRELPVLASDCIKQMVKEARPPRKTKQQQPEAEATTEWRRDNSGGGRHLAINLYDDELATKITHDALLRQITAVQVIKQAFRNSELVEEAQQDLTDAVNEIRGKHLEMQRQILDRDARIAALEAQLAELQQATLVAEPESVNREFQSWSEFADSVDCNRTTLLDMVKPWSLQERQALPILLAVYLSEEQDALDLVSWVPEKLLNSALLKLSFTVIKISGPDNLVDEPEIDEINGCRFVSVKHLGIRRREQWIFEGCGGRILTVFGRDEFKIEYSKFSIIPEVF